jgi:hypothetical protein
VAVLRIHHIYLFICAALRGCIIHGERKKAIMQGSAPRVFARTSPNALTMCHTAFACINFYLQTENDVCARATRSLPIDCRCSLTRSNYLFPLSFSLGHNLWLFSWQRKNPDAPRSVFLQLKERKKELRLKGLRRRRPLEFLCFALSHQLSEQTSQSLCALKAQSAIARRAPLLLGSGYK